MVFETLVFYAFLTWAAIQLLFAVFLFSRILWLKTKVLNPNASVHESISIIICAHNEVKNLVDNLPKILEQCYTFTDGTKAFEVIVVNDASTDETADVLSAFARQYRHLKTVTISKDAVRTHKGKKFALVTGIQHAANNWLLLTDADCQPASSNWAQHMINPLAHGKEIVAGYGAYYEDTGMLNIFTRWETVHAFLQWGSFSEARLPYMGVGRNLACTKAIIQQAAITPQWHQSASGDDDVLVSTCATPDNYTIVATPEAFTFTASQKILSAWVKQKQRHLSTGKTYKNSVKYLLGSYGFTHAAVWFYFPFALFTSHSNTVLVVMAIRCLVYWALMAKTATTLGDKKLISWLPIADFSWMIYNFTFLPYIVWKSKQHWK